MLGVVFEFDDLDTFLISDIGDDASDPSERILSSTRPEGDRDREGSKSGSRGGDVTDTTT